jgi:hypothetical protein
MTGAVERTPPASGRQGTVPEAHQPETFYLTRRRVERLTLVGWSSLRAPRLGGSQDPHRDYVPDQRQVLGGGCVIAAAKSAHDTL